MLVLAAIVGLPISAAAYGFLAVVDQLQTWLFTDLPTSLGYDAAPTWWPLPLLALSGVLVTLAIRHLPGTGGHTAAGRFKGGGAPYPAPASRGLLPPPPPPGPRCGARGSCARRRLQGGRRAAAGRASRGPARRARHPGARCRARAGGSADRDRQRPRRARRAPRRARRAADRSDRDRRDGELRGDQLAARLAAARRLPAARGVRPGRADARPRAPPGPARGRPRSPHLPRPRLADRPRCPLADRPGAASLRPSHRGDVRVGDRARARHAVPRPRHHAGRARDPVTRRGTDDLAGGGAGPRHRRAGDRLRSGDRQDGRERPVLRADGPRAAGRARGGLVSGRTAPARGLQG